MTCTEFQRRNYSDIILNQAMSDDSGSWWWWINAIGTLCFGTIGLIGNLICFLVVYRFSLPQHSFVQYLRALAIFDFLSLIFEFVQSLNDLFKYLLKINLLNFSSSYVCKFYEYSKHVVILLACWTIVGLTFDRLILVCDPWSKKWPNLSRRICNSQCAKKILFLLIILSLIINIPHLLYQQWVCRYSGYQYSAAFHGRLNMNQTLNTTFTICHCRISSDLDRRTLLFIIKWNTYVYHLFCYTLIPAIILIASNTGLLGDLFIQLIGLCKAILRVLHIPRKIVGQQNEHLRSKLTRTLTLVSLMFLVLYFPHALVENLSILLIPKYQYRCDVRPLIIIRILKRLSELLNIAALSINFFLYILGVNHYRSAAIQMLGLHHFDIFLPYLTVEHRNSLGSIVLFTKRRNTQTDNSTIKLLKVINNPTNNESPTLLMYNKPLSR